MTASPGDVPTTEQAISDRPAGAYSGAALLMTVVFATMPRRSPSTSSTGSPIGGSSAAKYQVVSARMAGGGSAGSSSAATTGSAATTTARQRIRASSVRTAPGATDRTGVSSTSRPN